MIGLAGIVLPPLAPESFTLISVLLGTAGTLFLAYDLLGRENGPLRWFTLVLTCGIVSALIFVPLALLNQLIFDSEGPQLSYILPFLLVGGLMGFYTVILVELPSSASKPPLFSRKGGLHGLALTLLFWLVGILVGFQYGLPALALGLTCALFTCTWQRLTWQPAQAGVTAPESGQSVAGEELSASSPTPSGTGQFVAWKLAYPRPRVFSRKGVVLGLLLGFLVWFVIFFIANKDVIASTIESVPLAVISGVICGTWQYINWEPPYPTPHFFSRKGFWGGLIAGFVPWLIFALTQSYASFATVTGPLKGLEVLLVLGEGIIVTGFYALANAAAGSIAQYTLWKANQFPHRTLGAIGLVLIIVSFGFQGMQPVIEILNNR